MGRSRSARAGGEEQEQRSRRGGAGGAGRKHDKDMVLCCVRLITVGTEARTGGRATPNRHSDNYKAGDVVQTAAFSAVLPSAVHSLIHML